MRSATHRTDGVEYSVEFARYRPKMSTQDVWFVDVVKLVGNSLTESQGLSVREDTEAAAFGRFPDVVTELVKFGLSRSKAERLCKDAIDRFRDGDIWQRVREKESLPV